LSITFQNSLFDRRDRSRSNNTHGLDSRTSLGFISDSRVKGACPLPAKDCSQYSSF